jgi:hypothetical protein
MHIRIYRCLSALIFLFSVSAFGTVTNPTVFYDVKTGQLNYTFDKIVEQVNNEFNNYITKIGTDTVNNIQINDGIIMYDTVLTTQAYIIRITNGIIIAVKK